MKPSLPIVLVLLIVVGIFLHIVAFRVSGLDKENKGNGSEDFTWRNFVAMVIFYGGIMFVIYLLFFSK